MFTYYSIIYSYIHSYTYLSVRENEVQNVSWQQILVSIDKVQG